MAPSLKKPFAISALLWEDERLWSWLDRVARLNGVPSARFLLTTKPIAWSARGRFDIDANAPKVLRQRLSHYLRVREDRIKAHLLGKDRSLSVSARRSACLDCWGQDLRSNKVAYWRRDWAHPLALVCPVHRKPLFDFMRVPSTSYEFFDLQASAATSLRKKPFGGGQPLKAFLAFDEWRRNLSVEDQQLSLQVMDIAARNLHKHMGPWEALSVRRKLRLYQFSARNSPSYSLLFGTPFAKPFDIGRPWRGFAAIGNIGYRRQMVYHVLDLFHARYRYRGDGINMIYPGRGWALEAHLTKDHFFDLVVEIGALAEKVMPSRSFGALRYLLRIWSPEQRIGSLFGA